MEKELIPTDKYKYFNHHHEMTDKQQLVDFGDGEFIANVDAVPLLKALSDVGLRTRTHHIDSSSESNFVSILVDPHVNFEIRQVDERDSGRTKYNGMTEFLISWSNNQV